ncbi:putative metal-nicotianamine transporter YSL7-like protein, partial [Trifolium pratense]
MPINSTRKIANNNETVVMVKDEEKLEEEEEEASIEKGFEGKSVPTWQKQITVRAIIVSFLLSVLFTFIVMKLNLTT